MNTRDSLAGAALTDDKAAFIQFAQTVNALNNGIHTDAEEWAQLTINCNGANGDVLAYALKSQSLWTNGEDQGSWTLVRNAAAQAVTQDEHRALITVLHGFLDITNPSHNEGQWGQLRDLAYALLNQVDPSPFQALMRMIKQIKGGTMPPHWYKLWVELQCT